ARERGIVGADALRGLLGEPGVLPAELVVALVARVTHSDLDARGFEPDPQLADLLAVRLHRRAVGRDLGPHRGDAFGVALLFGVGEVALHRDQAGLHALQLDFHTAELTAEPAVASE